jgi:hypothetical protein
MEIVEDEQAVKGSLSESEKRDECENTDSSSHIAPIALEERIKNAMLDEKGEDRWYSSNPELATRLLTAPNETWSIPQVEQAIEALLQEGKIKEYVPETNNVKSRDGERFFYLV